MGDAGAGADSGAVGPGVEGSASSPDSDGLSPGDDGAGVDVSTGAADDPTASDGTLPDGGGVASEPAGAVPELDPGEPVPEAELRRWRWENPTPLRNTLVSVWASEPNDVWVAGELGTLAHFDGAGWTREEGLPFVTLHTLWGSGPEDVWAGADEGVWRYDGAAWSRLLVPISGIAAIWGSGPDDVWIGGDGLLRWDGEGFTLSELPLEGRVTTLWGNSASDVWATVVGGETAWGVLRYDGERWRSVAAPETFPDTLPETVVALHVTGTSADDVWVALDEFPPDRFVPQTTGWHWNGQAWSGHPSDFSQLHSFAVTEPGGAWALHREGALFRIRAEEPWFVGVASPIAYPELFGLGVSRGGRLFAVGAGGLVFSWNGEAWVDHAPGARPGGLGLSALRGALWAHGGSYREPSGVLSDRLGPLPYLSPTTLPGSLTTVVDVTETSEGERWAIGHHSLHHHDGDAWTLVDEWEPGSRGATRAIYASAPDDVWIAYQRGLRRGDGASFQDFESGANDVDGSAPDDVWAVWGRGARHFDGADWTEFDFAEDELVSLSVPGAGVAFAVGGATAARWDGERWQVQSVDAALSGVHAPGSEEAWAVGTRGSGEERRGVVYHYEGGVWVDVPIRAGPLYAAASDGERLWVIGSYGALLSREL